MASRMQFDTFSACGSPFSGYSAAVISESVARRIRSRSIWHAYVTYDLMLVALIAFAMRLAARLCSRVARSALRPALLSAWWR